MKARFWIAVGALVSISACTAIEPAEDMANARYGKVVSAQRLDGMKQRIVVRMGDGSTVDVTQDRDSAILEGDVVRVLGTGSNTRVRKL